MIANKLYKNYQCLPFYLRNYSLSMTTQTSKYLCSSSLSHNTSTNLIRKITTTSVRKGGPPKSQKNNQSLQKSSPGLAPGISIKEIPEKSKRGLAEPVIEHSGFPFFYLIPILLMGFSFSCIWMKNRHDNYQSYLRYRKEEALGIDNTNTPMHMREQWRKHAEDADRGYMMIPKSGIWYQPFYQPFNDPRNEEVEPPIRTIPADDPKPKE